MSFAYDTPPNAKRWGTDMGSRSNADGTTSFISSTPGMIGLEMVAGSKDSKRTLVVRDSQHEYVFSEVTP